MGGFYMQYLESKSPMAFPRISLLLPNMVLPNIVLGEKSNNSFRREALGWFMNNPIAPSTQYV